MWNVIGNELAKLEDKIIEFNRAQVRYGNRADGTEIEPPYAEITKHFKSNDGTLTNGDPTIVNLYDSGSFYAGFYILITKDEVIIDSRDSKSDALQDKYGTEIFGLTDSNLKTVLQIVKERVINNVREQIKNL